MRHCFFQMHNRKILAQTAERVKFEAHGAQKPEFTHSK